MLRKTCYQTKQRLMPLVVITWFGYLSVALQAVQSSNTLVVR